MMAVARGTQPDPYGDPRKRSSLSRSGSPAASSTTSNRHSLRNNTTPKNLRREPSSFAGASYRSSNTSPPTKNSCPYPTLPSTTPHTNGNNNHGSTSLQRAMVASDKSSVSGSTTRRQRRQIDGNHGSASSSSSSLKRAMGAGKSGSSASVASVSVSGSTHRPLSGRRKVQSFPINKPRSSSSSWKTPPPPSTREPSRFATSKKELVQRDSISSMKNSFAAPVDKNSNHTCSTRSCSVSPITTPDEAVGNHRKSMSNYDNMKTAPAPSWSSVPQQQEESQLYVGLPPPSAAAVAANNGINEQRCTTFEDMTRIAANYGMEMFSNHRNRRKSSAFIPSCNEMNEMEVSPGVSLPFRGVKETWEAVANQRTIRTTCMDCGITLISVQDCEYVVCPDCQMVNPIIQQSGVGLGLKEEWVDQAKKIGRHPPMAA